MNETTKKSLEQVVHECGRYPIEAFEFVRLGLNQTVQHIHGAAADQPDAEATCHVSGQQLSWGLRNLAIQRYGLIARAVLAHWGIHRTNDFGRIVFAMVQSKLLQKTEEDDLRDFENVFDFNAVFDPPARPTRAPKIVFTL